MSLSTGTRDKLKAVSTATLCTALFKMGLRHQFIQNVRPLNAKLPNMVGEAFTLRYMPAREDLNPMTVFLDPAHPQRKAVEECPPGAVLVMDSRKDARAASAGAILVTRLMVRGVAGVVTDGGFRDSPEIAQLAIPSYHSQPSAPANITHHQAIAINEPISKPASILQRGGRRMGASLVSHHTREALIQRFPCLLRLDTSILDHLGPAVNLQLDELCVMFGATWRNHEAH